MKSLFEFAIELASVIRELPDQRPARLRYLRDATHPTCPYYQYLHDLVRHRSPLNVIEIGTYVGTSAAHLAWDNLGRVVTIDNQPDAKRRVDNLRIANITAITADSMNAAPLITGNDYDVLYIDGHHDFARAYAEYVTYRSFLRHGGIILVDDANLEMDGDEMNVFWDYVGEPKQRLDWLHTTGFGIIRKDDHATPTPFHAAVEAVAPSIISRRKHKPT